MAEQSGFLVPVRKADIVVGQPLPWAVYDASRNLLLNRGVVVNSEHQVEVLLEKGLFREQRRTPAASVAGTLDNEADAGGPDGPRAQESALSFDDIKLMPGDALQLQPMLEGQSERYTVRVIGVMKPTSVLVTAPAVEGKLVFVREGQPFLVRAFSGLNVCAFKAKVLKSQLAPFPYLHLAYPDSVQAMRIRKAMRAPVQIIAAIQEGEGGRQVAAGMMTDISVGGARILCPQRFAEKDAHVYLSFKVRLGDMEEYIKTPAQVRSIGEGEEESGRRTNAYGVQFGDLPQTQRLIIMNLVYQHMLKDSF